MNDYGFDSSGNTTKDANGRTFIYDAENKQIEVKNASDETIGKYWYDGDGRRVKKRGWINGQWEETIFVYDASSRLVAEYSTDLNETPQVAYLTNDHLGSPRINTNENGAVISRHDYLPYGEEVTERTHAQYVGDTIRKQFTGYERDGETDLDFAQARYFSSGFGRFSSPDSFGGSGFVGIPQSWNRYSYCLNRPLLFTDPSGLIWLTNDGGMNHIWVPDKDYERNKSKFDGYEVSNGSVIILGSVTGFGGRYDNLIGSWVSLNANGTISVATEPASVQVNDEYSQDEIVNPYYGFLLGTQTSGRTPSHGPPNSYRKFRSKGGGYTIRWYDANGRAVIDIDIGQGDHHGVGMGKDQEVHWWDWNSESPRSDGPVTSVPGQWGDSIESCGNAINKKSSVSLF